MRKNGYYGEDKHYVSVTKVLKVLAKEGIENWKIDIATKGAVHNVLLELNQVLRNSPELVKGFIHRTDLLTSSGDQGRLALQKEFESATGLGTELHNTIQSLFNGSNPTPNKIIERAFNSVKDFIEKMGIKPEGVEKTIQSEDGWAGTLDLLQNVDAKMIRKMMTYVYGKTEIQEGLTVCDWKTTKNVKQFYDESAWQISAYAKKVGATQGLIINVNKLTGEIKVKPVDVVKGYEKFDSIFNAWKMCKAPQWWKKEWGLM